MSSPHIKGLLLDLSGTLYVGDAPVEDALEAVRTIREADLPLLFVTNTTSKPRARILERMERLGFDVRPDEVFTPPIAASRMLREAGHHRCHFLLKPEVMGDLAHFEATEERPDAVVIGDIGDGFDYETLNHCFNLLMQGAAFYALAANRYFESGGGLKLDVGPFVAALEYAVNRKTILIGKPAADFFKAAAAILDLAPEQVAMVGDDIESDVGGAMDAGLTGILVRTGKYREEHAARSGIEPDHDLGSIAGLPGLLGL